MTNKERNIKQNDILLPYHLHTYFAIQFCVILIEFPWYNTRILFDCHKTVIWSHDTLIASHIWKCTITHLWIILDAQSLIYKEYWP